MHIFLSKNHRSVQPPTVSVASRQSLPPNKPPAGPLSASYGSATGNAVTLLQQHAMAQMAGAKQAPYSITVIPTKKLQAIVPPPTSVESIDLTDEDDANTIAASRPTSHTALPSTVARNRTPSAGNNGNGNSNGASNANAAGYVVNQTPSGVRYASQIPSASSSSSLLGGIGAMSGPTRVRVGGNTNATTGELLKRLNVLNRSRFS